jgi:putative DNA primase/helicase
MGEIKASDEATQARVDNIIYLRSDIADLRARMRQGIWIPADRRRLIEDWRHLTRAIDDFGQSLGVSPSPDPLAEEVEREAAAADAHDEREIERRKNNPPGSVGAQRVPRATEAFDPRYPESKPKSRKKKVKVVMGTSVSTRPISWLWPDWLAHGKLHIFAGRPGCLKTTTAIDFAAGVTVGGYWPDRTRMAQGNVVVWSGEDAIDDTLLPRFIAAGGDRNHIAFIAGVEENGNSRAFDPAGDMEALADVCDELGNVNLIIVDPVVMIARGDSHKNAETRKDLQPLVDLAERTQAVVIGIHHLTKRSEGANPVDRVSGSLAFGAAPRVILLNALDPKGGAEPRGVLMRAKSNIGPSHGGYSFTAEQRPLDDEPDISAQHILWGGYVDRGAGDILEEFEGKAKAAVERKRKIAQFLTEAMANGPRMAAEVEDEGEKLGFAVWAMRRVFKKLGGQSLKPSFKSGWVWELPGQAA